MFLFGPYSHFWCGRDADIQVEHTNQNQQNVLYTVYYNFSYLESPSGSKVPLQDGENTQNDLFAAVTNQKLKDSVAAP